MSAAGPAIVGGLATTAVVAAAANRRGRGQQKRGQLIDLQAFENELGVQAPVGFFDPLNFTGEGDVEDFRRRRETELKNGRVAMFATMGYIVPEYFKFPGFLSPSAGLKFADVPNGLKALEKVPTEGWLQIIALGGFYELVVNQPQNPNEPGNYGRGKFGFTGESISDPEQRKRCLNAELANGRLAMMAIIGMFFQDGLTGSAWGDWALYEASPLRAFENELGVQSPVGFWDPLGLAADGNEERFRRRRETEIKHGRVSMLATMGYITPEVSGKFGGYLSPSQDIKFEDVPNGLAAISKVPLAGWVQIFFYAAFCEVSAMRTRTDEPGNLGFKPPLLTTDDPILRQRRLASELANGRLAMFAIMGMFFQDGLTGSAWGDWSNYFDSSVLAFENELGAQEPLGFWDPLGLSADGDLETFTRRRESEIKHGRISMLATMGYITPELTGKFPGFLSPSSELQYADIPNGLGAISKVPALGWGQIVLYCAAVEAAGANRRGEAPGDFGWKVLTSDDPEQKQKKLAAELANGRLAMMAIIGMFFQDGLTGSAWGDWANYTASPLRAVDLSTELGACPPLGFWDPLDLSKFEDPDVAAFQFKRRRVIELQHGRVSMLACIGYIVPEYFKWPGYLSPSEELKFEDIPNGLGAVEKVPFIGWVQILAFVGLIEVFNLQSEPKEYPGDYELFGAFGIPGGGSIEDKEKKEKSLLAEINNGRLAMMAIIGMFFQNGLTGSAWGDWANYTASPLRAFENDLGVQAPVGFFDPLGLASDGDIDTFNRRRESELKHGRISMLAAMGYITPEVVGKFPGQLSFTEKLSFADVPNGLKALSVVPASGWLQILLYMSYVEVSGISQRNDVNYGKPGDFDFKVLTSDDPEKLKRKLNSELANGRLAMMAIIGMFFQDGLTGSAWGDWANYTDSPLR